jgi:HK97 family phage major capsid protein
MAVTSLLVSIINDEDRVIDVKFAKNLFAAIVADTTNVVLTGYSASTTAAFMTYKKALALKAAILSATFKNPGFVMGSDLYSFLQGTSGGTTMQTAISDLSKIAGFNAYDASDLMSVHDTNKYDIIFGDWARAYVATFGSNVMGLLVNPYEFDDEGQVKLRFTKLGDVSYNPYTFKAIRNNKVV